MHFNALDLSDLDLWNINLLDTHLDLLDADIPSKHFVCPQDVLKTSSRHAVKTSWRCFQRNNFSSSKTSSRRLKDALRDVFKTSSRRLQDVLKTSWKTKNCYVEDVSKASSRRLEDQQMFAGNQLMSSWEIKPLHANCYNLFWTCRKLQSNHLKVLYS